MSEEWKHFYDSTEVSDVEFETIPDDSYNFVISNTTFDDTKEPNRVSIECQILDGKFEGRKVWANFQLAKKGPYFLKKSLMALGIDEPKSMNLLNDLESIVGKKCEGNTRNNTYKAYDGTSKIATNVYINNLIDESAPKNVENDKFDL